MRKQVIFLAVCCLCAMNRATAYDFSAVNNGQTIYYNITSSTSPLTVAVTHGDQMWYSYQGNVVVPDTVSYNGNTYTVTAIGDEAFRLCSALTSITIPLSVTTIRKNAFILCSRLTSITIPHLVTTIGWGAFAECISLTEIHVKTTTPPQISGLTFEKVPVSIPVYVCGKVEDYKTANYWKKFTNILPDNDCDIQEEDTY
jgi:hypothetical protein